MSLREVQIIIKNDLLKTLEEIISGFASDLRHWSTDTHHEGYIQTATVMPSDYTQNFIEEIEKKIPKSALYQIVVTAVEATTPKIEEPEKPQDTKKKGDFIKSISYDEVYFNVESQTKLTVNFLLLVILSTVVAVIGIITDNIPTLIGAMLIAPLLGPNLGLALSTILFDIKLMKKSLITNATGIVVALVLSFLIGLLISFVTRTQIHGLFLIDHVTYSSIILAAASGAAAALYLLSGTAGSLVGVMVATALLPPTAVTGVALSVGHFYDALSAFLLLIVNIVCITLGANLMFLLKGIKPQSWYEKKRAKWANLIFVLILCFLLLILFAAVFFLLRIHG